jgi:hypothetical protein
VQCAISNAMLDKVGDLSLRLMQDQARQAGALLAPAMTRSYMQRSDNEREGMRAACKHVVVALVLLGIIDAPDL